MTSHPTVGWMLVDLIRTTMQVVGAYVISRRVIRWAHRNTNTKEQP